jgi:hypothetical protein
MSETNLSETTNSIFNELGRQAAQVSSTAFGLPRRIEDTLDRLDQGDIRLRVRATETDRILRRVSSVQMGTNYALLMGAFTISATLLFISDKVGWAIVLVFLALFMGMAFFRLLRRLDRFDRMF